MLKSTAKKARSSINYQDNVNTALDWEHDIDSTADEDDKEDDEGSTMESTSQVKAAVLKVSLDLVILSLISY